MKMTTKKKKKKVTGLFQPGERTPSPAGWAPAPLFYIITHPLMSTDRCALRFLPTHSRISTDWVVCSLPRPSNSQPAPGLFPLGQRTPLILDCPPSS